VLDNEPRNLHGRNNSIYEISHSGQGLACASLKGACCASSARQDLRGGRLATDVPTLIGDSAHPMKRAILSSALAWIVGIIFLMATGYAMQSASHSTIEFGWAFLQGTLYIALGVGVVVFPTCLVVVFPLLRLIPLSSPLLRPSIALSIGVVSGPIAMYIWAAVLSRGAFVPNIHDEGHVFFGCASALIGATFAFSYALFHRNDR
jgi:hypothetical protein